MPPIHASLSTGTGFRWRMCTYSGKSVFPGF